MKVEILNPDEFKELFKRFGLFACQCYNTPDKYATHVGRSCLETGHTSGSRSRFVEMRISGVSRSLADQLVRHEQGVVKNVQSQRYVFDDFNYYTDPVVANNYTLNEFYIQAMETISELRTDFKSLIEQELGYTGEKANEIVRCINPMAIHTKVAIAFNIEALIHLCHQRLCTCSQREIRDLTQLIVDEVLKIIPELEDKLVPKCEYLLWCPESEKRSCGRFPTKQKLRERLSSQVNTN